MLRPKTTGYASVDFLGVPVSGCVKDSPAVFCLRISHHLCKFSIATAVGKFSKSMAILADIITNISHKEQVEFLKLIADATNEATEGIVISDTGLPDNPIIYANEGFERLTGYSRHEILGKNCRFLQGKDTDPNTINEIRQAIRRGVPCKVDILNYRKDGSRFWNRLSITPLRDKSGTIVNFVGVQFDITELKETRERLERANAVLEKFQSEMNAELEQARRAQEAILPPNKPQSEYMEVGVKFVPLSQIGGDFYDIVQITEYSYGFLIADVTGHGIPAALLTFMSATAFKNSAVGVLSTSDVIEDTNMRIFNKMPGGTFATMFYAIYNVLTRELTYTQAGHPPALLIRPRQQKVTTLATKGSLVGIFSGDMVQYGEGTSILEPGDVVILYTDAISESIGRRYEGQDIEKLIEFIRQRINVPLNDLLEDVYHYALECNAKQLYEDDVTLLGFKILK
ncbi:PAS domain-containing protein [candidate division KSB1 bacterium]|nr:SpoIIE family protein phosphatase [candidate division KSB1 bacterium]RQW00597.1 MAG: PAS domain-containing protein [candidate division KSB1 bacterium]